MVQGKWQFSPVSQNHFQDVSNLSTNGTKVLCICFFRLSDVPKKITQLSGSYSYYDFNLDLFLYIENAILPE
jgi:hypothetical protein